VQFACRIENLERCTKQSAPIAVKNVKFHSSQILADPFTVEIVGRREDNREDLDIRLHPAARLFASIFSKILFYFLCNLV
jgi:hypothetical protein